MVTLAFNAAWAQIMDNFETTNCPTTPCQGVISGGCLASWRTSHGTPRIIEGGYNSTKALHMIYDVNSENPGGEGAFRTYAFEPGKCYRITFWRKYKAVDIAGVFQVLLSNGLVEDTNFSPCYDPVPLGGGPFQTLYTENLPVQTQSDWEQITLDFTPSTSYTGLWLYADPASTAVIAHGGNISIDLLQIFEDEFPVADFSYHAQDMCNAEMIFFQSLSQHVDTWSWNFGDGMASEMENPVHTYVPGTYDVTLTVTNLCGSDSHTQTVTVVATTYDYTIPFSMTLQFAIDNNYLPSTFPNSIENASILVQGELTIDKSPFTFKDCNLTMEGGTRILIDPFKTLILDGCNLSGCEAMWRGIHLTSVFGSNALKIVNSYISDAEYAVVPAARSTIDITHSTFEENLISLYFTISGFDFMLNPFHSNTFTSSGAMLQPYLGQSSIVGEHPYAAIVLSPKPVANIGVAGEGANVFRNLANGILTDHCDLTVVNSSFENILETADYPSAPVGFGIRCEGANTSQLIQEGFGNGLSSSFSFRNCTQAIASIQSGAIIAKNHMQNVNNGVRVESVANQKVVVENNRINSIYNGIELIGNDAAQSLAVIENDIFIGQGQASFFEGNGISIIENGIMHPFRSIIDNKVYLYANNTGIYFNNARRYFATQNHIYMKAGYGFKVDGAAFSNINCNKVFGEGGGIGLTATTSNDMSYYCNWLSHTKTGASFEGACLTTNIQTNSFFPPFRSGLSYGSAVMINPQIHRGNLWYGEDTDYSVAAAVNLITTNVANDIAAVRFEVNTTQQPAYPPSVALPNAPLIPANVWFQTTPGNLPSCPDPDNCGELALLTEGDEDTRKKVASGEYANASYGGAVAWQAQRQLYQQLDANSELQTESVEVAQFYGANEQSVLGRLHGIQKGISALNGLLPEKRESLYGINDAVRVHMDEIRAIDVNLAQAQGSTYTILLAERQSKLDTIEILGQDADDLADLILAAQTAEADVLIVNNAAIPASTVYETNEKTVNGIYLGTVAKGITAFSTAQQSTLKTIAEQCPLFGGIGVYQARSLYALIERAYYDDEQGCTTSQQMQVPQTQSFSSRNDFKTYPNPSTGVFTLAYSLEDDATLAIQDIMGRAVYNLVLSAGKENVSFSPGQVLPGMYILKVFTNGEVLHLEKIIIIR